jgi:hypothetical protein|tara:strand:- start:1095 stop:1379 length:285 start_codon:yes stop_codon:yes gene_type:complete
MDDLELFNRLARIARPAHTEYTPLTDLNTPFPDTGLDSMDGLMLSIFYGDIYGVPEEVSKEFLFNTPAELLALVKQHKTLEPESIDTALERVQW